MVRYSSASPCRPPTCRPAAGRLLRAGLERLRRRDRRRGDLEHSAQRRRIAADFAGGIDDSSLDLAGHWRFEEGGGLQATDASTFANHGTLGGGVPGAEPARFVGEVPEVPEFAALAPTHTRIGEGIGYGFYPENFAGFDDLDAYFAARWTGQIVIDIPGMATSGPVTFATISDARSRIYIDDVLRVDHTDLLSTSISQTTIVLDEGIHDIRFEYVHAQGLATAALGWDLAGGGSLELVPVTELVRTDATRFDPTAEGIHAG